MSKPTGRLVLVSFALHADRDAVFNTLTGLGYSVDVVQDEDGLRAEGESFVSPTVLLLACDNYPRHKILSGLANANNVPILGVLTRDETHWDEEIVGCCTDFLRWPCHREELVMRLQRVFGGREMVSSVAHEMPTPEGFIGLDMLGTSPRFVEAVKLAKKFAGCDVPVLIEGDTGTGKELAARTIHYLGARRDYPFIPVSCGAVPDSLIENELFGHEKGAFTDAKDKQPGLIAQAQGGTLFLDEIDTLSAKAQVALLRFLEVQEYKPLGGKGLTKANVRIVAATNADLHELIKKGLFRQDLFFRLDVLSVRLPPLRQRGGDIEFLAKHFIRECSTRYNQAGKYLHPETLAWMRHYTWPGNVRELENLIHREFLLAEGPVISMPDKAQGHDRFKDPIGQIQSAPFGGGFKQAKASVIAEFEKEYLYRLMADTRGNISLAAKRVGKERRALGKLLKKHGIDKDQWSSSR